MKIEDVRVGMKVRIREWDDMEREFGLLRALVINVAFGFTGDMRRFCGVCAEVVSINNNIIKLNKKFGNSWRNNYSISADMLEPITEEFTMPPPPDLGELHGVKLPAWMWSSSRNILVYVFFHRCDSIFITYIHDGSVYHSRAELVEPYTGQDKIPVVDVEALKRAARLV